MTDDKTPEQGGPNVRPGEAPTSDRAASEAANSAGRNDHARAQPTDVPFDWPLEGDELPEPPRMHHDDLIAELRRDVSDLKDRILRAHAEVDNMRKRTEQEKKDTAKYAITRFANDIVNVGDNFQRAIAAVPAGAADQDPALQSLLDGVTLSEREFLLVLERHGVKRVDPQGEPFNPHLHQAVVQQESAAVPANTVLQVFQAGFTIEDRVLRPAMVIVSTGGPKPAPPPEAAPEPAQNVATDVGTGGPDAPKPAPSDRDPSAA